MTNEEFIAETLRIKKAQQLQEEIQHLQNLYDQVADWSAIRLDDEVSAFTELRLYTQSGTSPIYLKDMPDADVEALQKQVTEIFQVYFARRQLAAQEEFNKL